MEKFAQILYDLGQLIDEDLFPNEIGACRLNMNEKFSMQMQVDDSGKYLLIITAIAEISPGKYKENVLREALKENERMRGTMGDFGFSDKLGKLMHSTRLLLDEVTGSSLGDELELLVPYIESWYDAIKNGQAGPNPEPSNGPSPFNMRP